VTIFIDTAILMYAGGSEHPLREPSRAVLRAAVEGRLEAVTSVEVVQEILHRYIAIRRLDAGVAMARETIAAFGPLLPITHAVVERMPGLVERYPALSARDLVHVATCLEEGISAIVSPDRGFDSVSEIRRLDPTEASGMLSAG
jgi:predicted nucleic acid-binding protein